ncbi:uncharacterized protein FFB20_04874 [Fusarium fujikuroi]|uniref:Uncharacterized protein n=1 Tax=Fusarium fujikuroi TaxID=5127 RepID=A0A2H3RRN0_FUSFU|nr:hypothetical protein CEK27_005917 [Fusarium fujikuroi]QGI79124.1 hypothetical protein CEK25_005853 [Fusarium fujikuroi]QGI92844.1 hypothetical protein CEK26_005913 [Fusarium fujikuroi]SCN75476.1 uncharacterized protein FFB20_04874 [Fusarium fujikuroi]SCN76602.1 uncharacterized protein FFE2_03562 [Fusarium fujikuroi]
MSVTNTEIECARNIALLYYLGKIGCKPQKNSIQDCEPICKADINRALSLQDEKSLTSTLAFLSSIRDDAMRVTAVCVEEKKSGVVVMIAANAKHNLNSSPYLDAVKEGFDKIFRSLNRETPVSCEELHRQIIRIVISMCRSRIMSRARFIRRGQRQGFNTVLKKVKKEMARFTMNDDKREYMRLSQVLISRIDDFQIRLAQDPSSTSALDKKLDLIISTFADISRIPTLSTMLLQDIRPRMEPDLCSCLLNTVHKLAHYDTCAWTLVKLSRTYSILGRTCTIPVRLDDTAFGKPPAETMVFKLEEHLKKLRKEYKTNWALDNLGQRLATNTKKFWEDFLRVTNEPKIHAEIQLLWHLERHPGSKPPRVIASNKDACFLCNAFILLHGQYMIPKTHGRIYPGWRLPWTGLNETRGLFVRELERIAVERLNVIHQQGVEKNIDPLESTISLAAISTTPLNRSRETKDMQPAMTLTNTGINSEVLDAICLQQPTKPRRSKAGVKTRINTKNLDAERTKVSLIRRNSPISSQETMVLAQESANEIEKAQGQAPILVGEPNDIASKETEYGLNKTAIPETYQTRPSSIYFPESKHSDHKSSLGSTTWGQVEQDSTKRMKLNSFNLYIEYTSSDPNTS